jgi:hypothetical protein
MTVRWGQLKRLCRGSYAVMVTPVTEPRTFPRDDAKVRPKGTRVVSLRAESLATGQATGAAPDQRWGLLRSQMSLKRLEVLCPHIYSTDLNELICKRLEKPDLTCVRSLPRPAASPIVRHAPHRAYEVQGQERQLEPLKLAILLPTSGVNAGDPPPGIVDTGV